MNGGALIAQGLHAQGVRFLFTLCGGHISPILVESKKLGIRVVDTRHEATAVFAADAVARLTGVPGVAAVTAGPGVTNTLTAVQNARSAQSPLVLLGGAAATVLRGRGSLQDIDQLALIRSSVKWTGRATRVAQLPALLETAFRQARSGVPGPVFLECPIDLLYDESLVRSWYAAKTDAATGRGLADRALAAYLRWHLDRQFAGAATATAEVARQAVVPSPSARRVTAAAKALARAERPLMLIGSQAVVEAGAVGTLRSAVERLGVPVYLSGMARGLLGAGHPLQYRHRRRDALREADLVILAGVPCDFRLDYGAHVRRSATLIAANRSRRDLYLNRRPTLPVPGDAGLFVQALAKARPGAQEAWAQWRQQLAAREAEREAEIDRQAAAESDGVNPLGLCREIDAAMPDNTVIVADGGDFVATASYILQPRAPLSWLDPGVFGTLGVGAGFALGASLCRPDAEVWAIFGDGAFGYSLAEYDTFVRHRIPVIGLVGNDACWTQIVREQVEILGDDVGCPLRPADYDQAAAGLGARGLSIRAGSEGPVVLQEARRLAAGGEPVLINALLGKTEFRKGSVSM